ncbi:MAG: IS1595 family transposase [Gemmatimonadetes bacterium]|nr:IS1595 family transposase [Gemmatimonadota bacterium]MYG37149.1 IS1595 family transposase [Gemmatimonadota bacterium]
MTTPDTERTMAKGPGKHYRNGLSLIEVMNMFPTDEAAREWFEEVRWGGEPACCDCGSLNVQCGASHPSQTHRCRDCRKFFSVTKGTAMERTKLGLRVWAIAIYLMSTELKGRASMKLRRDLGITQKAAWHLAHRLRQAWEENNGLSLFDGPVEVDEAYFGGKRANMSNARRKELEGAGRGPVTMTAVVGAKDRETNQVAARVIDSTDRATLQGFVDEHASPDAALLHGRRDGVPGQWPGARDRQTQRGGIRPVSRRRDDPHQRRRELLVHAQAGAQGDVPPTEPEAPPALRERVLWAAQRPGVGHHRPDAVAGEGARREAAPVQGPDRRHRRSGHGQLGGYGRQHPRRSGPHLGGSEVRHRHG